MVHFKTAGWKMKTSDGKNPRLPPYKYHPAQKEARLSARVLAEVQVGRGEEELRCNSLFNA